MNVKFLLVVFLIVLLAVTLAYSLETLRTLHNVGTVKAAGIGVYEDVNCTVVLTQIDWGFLSPGSVQTKSGWVRNEGNVPLVVSMSTQNWSPENASMYISLAWNLQGFSLQSGEVKSCVFTLKIFANVSGITGFSFDIMVEGRE